MTNRNIIDFKSRADDAVNLALEYFKQNNVSERLLDAISYSLSNGGKRVRASLLYAVGDAFEVDSSVLDKAASALEMIHAYSLIHDDLPAMDDDDLRRGKPTCHIAFDDATAILAGDALQAMSYEYLCLIDLSPNISANQILKVMRTLAKYSGVNGMVAGQMLDIEADKITVDLAELEIVHQHKTGDLLCASVLIGFYLSALYQDKKIETALIAFAKNIGLAFQIQDDILDVTSNTEILGKEARHDQATNKQTYPSLIGLEKSELLLNNCFDRSIQALELVSINLNKLKEIASFIVKRTN